MGLLGRHFNNSEIAHALNLVINLLLDAAAVHAVEVYAEETAAFQREITHIREQLKPDCPVDEILVHIGAAANAVERYNERTTRTIREQGTELQNMVAMLSNALVTVIGSGARSVETLERLKTDLEKAAGIEDLHILKRDLRSCLSSVCDEVARQKTETEDLVKQLRDHTRAAKKAGFDPGLDRVTNLPMRAAAEADLHRQLSLPGTKYAVVVVMDRLQSINARFGYHVGDQALQALSDHLQQVLVGASERLIRWSGPALVALLTTEEPLERVRATVRHAMDARLQKVFEIGERTALIPISGAWNVIPLTPPYAGVVASIQKFVESQTPKE